ncbi:phosphatase PAP2 family protein [Kitasatospora sp. NPDC048540]|uniref:phosphatase PAP2 family protein n=1 Tax=unclassified Kitasatospora TaxID=2633591 RepID=UPI00068CF2EA|nr:phosphatase PAP2 family protein [Kitasatospora sp. MBT63]
MHAPGAAARSTVLPLSLLALLTVVSWQVAADGPLLGLDRVARRATYEFRHDLHSTAVNHLGVALSDLGGNVPAFALLLLGGATAAWLRHCAGAQRRRRPLAVAVLAGALVPALVIPGKALFARPGPFGVPLSPEQLGWYPSGHTATSTIAYGAAALLVGRELGAPARRRLYAGTALLCAGVGWGLVWSDYHWLLDVVASWCLGALVLWGLARWAAPAPTGPDGLEPDRAADRSAH